MASVDVNHWVADHPVQTNLIVTLGFVWDNMIIAADLRSALIGRNKALACAIAAVSAAPLARTLLQSYTTLLTGSCAGNSNAVSQPT